MIWKTSEGFDGVICIPNQPRAAGQATSFPRYLVSLSPELLKSVPAHAETRMRLLLILVRVRQIAFVETDSSVCGLCIHIFCMVDNDKRNIVNCANAYFDVSYHGKSCMYSRPDLLTSS